MHFIIMKCETTDTEIVLLQILHILLFQQSSIVSLTAHLEIFRLVIFNPVCQLIFNWFSDGIVFHIKRSCYMELEIVFRSCPQSFLNCFQVKRVFLCNFIYRSRATWSLTFQVFGQVLPFYWVPRKYIYVSRNLRPIRSFCI